jgi:hypothetical protein
MYVYRTARLDQKYGEVALSVQGIQAVYDARTRAESELVGKRRVLYPQLPHAVNLGHGDNYNDVWIRDNVPRRERSRFYTDVYRPEDAYREALGSHNFKDKAQLAYQMRRTIQDLAAKQDAQMAAGNVQAAAKTEQQIQKVEGQLDAVVAGGGGGDVEWGERKLSSDEYPILKQLFPFFPNNEPVVIPQSVLKSVWSHTGNKWKANTEANWQDFLDLNNAFGAWMWRNNRVLCPVPESSPPGFDMNAVQVFVTVVHTALMEFRRIVGK